MNKVKIIMYHYVRDLKNSRYININGLDIKLFREQIKFLKENYNIISVEEIIEAIERKKDLPNESVLLTFDDGYLDHYTNVFPILVENKIKGFFSMPAKVLAEQKVLDVNKIHFILASNSIEKLIKKIFNKLDYYRGSEFLIPRNDDLYNELAIASRFDIKEVAFIKSLLQYALPEQLRNVIVDELFKESIYLSEEAFCNELYMNYDQIKVMKKCGMTFGIHGYDHYWLSKLSSKGMQKDILKALNFFDGIIDKKNWTMCYPYGDYNDEILNYLSNNGCNLAFTTEVRVADIKEDSRYSLPRLDTNDFPPKSENFKKYL